MKARQRRRRFRHLHQRQNPLVHPRAAAGTGNDDQRQVLLLRPFDRSRQFFADDGAHTPHNETGVGNGERHFPRSHPSATGNDRVAKPGRLAVVDETVFIRFSIAEIQRVGGDHIGVPLLERSFVERLRDPFLRGDRPVIIALGTRSQPTLRLLAEDRRLTAGAPHPKPLRNAAFIFRIVGILPTHPFGFLNFVSFLKNIRDLSFSSTFNPTTLTIAQRLPDLTGSPLVVGCNASATVAGFAGFTGFNGSNARPLAAGFGDRDAFAGFNVFPSSRLPPILPVLTPFR